MVDTDITGKAWRVTYTIFSGALLDPITRGSKWIWASNPMLGSETDPNLHYPIVVIDPFSTPEGTEIALGNDHVENRIATTVEIHDNAGGSRFDAISDQLINGFWANTENFAKSGMMMPHLTGGGYDQIALSRNNRLHIKSFGLEFKTL